MASLTYLVLSLVLYIVVLGSIESPQHWIDNGRRDIQRAFQIRPNYGLAKNTVLMIGDGMGLQTVTAGRIFRGQQQGKSGEECKLSFEDFPNIGLSKTYTSDRQVPDSAGASTAMYSGVKVNLGTLGVNPYVLHEESCRTFSEDRKLKTILDYALEEGKSVGFVTTTRVTHSTPAAMFAHTPNRNWESDANMAEVKDCDGLVKDIAYQLVKENKNINVILGGGRRNFIPNTSVDPVTGEASSVHRRDGIDLIKEWEKDKKDRGFRAAKAFNKGELYAVDTNKTDYLLGLFTSSHMSFDLVRDPSPSGEPSLAEMVETAILILKKNPRGFFLLVEGGRIDHAHHGNEAKLALGDLVAFDDAVQQVMNMTSVNETLTIVTADHSHVFGIAGYPSRGNPILGLVDIVDDDNRPFDDMPYTTLTYSNGPANVRVNLTEIDTTANNFQQQAGLGMKWETHSGEEVTIYAQGPMSHMFHTTHEQSYIAHVMQYASCLGLYKDACDIEERKKLRSSHPLQ